MRRRKESARGEKHRFPAFARQRKKPKKGILTTFRGLLQSASLTAPSRREPFARRSVINNFVRVSGHLSCLPAEGGVAVRRRKESARGEKHRFPTFARQRKKPKKGILTTVRGLLQSASLTAPSAMLSIIRPRQRTPIVPPGFKEPNCRQEVSLTPVPGGESRDADALFATDRRTYVRRREQRVQGKADKQRNGTATAVPFLP